MSIKDRAKQLKTDIPALLIALKDKKTPFIAKILVCIIMIYACSPIDLIPDFIPVFGYLDDIIILPVLVMITIKLIPIYILNRCREEAKTKDVVKKRWFFAIPFIGIWILVIYLIANHLK